MSNRVSRFVASGSIQMYRLSMVVLIVGGIIGQVLVDKIDSGWGLFWSAVLLVVTAVGVWILGELRAGSIRETAIAARGETLLDIGNILEPLTRELGRVETLGKGDRRLERGALRQAVLNAASGLSKAQLRANYFELSDDGKQMLPVAATGRALPPKEGFFEGRKSGDAALQMVRDDGYLFCDDTDLNPPTGWIPSNNREYRTFISVTVGTPGKPAGMLTLDAPSPGELTDEDVRMMLVLGRILGLAEEMTR